uniref:Nodule-specific Glycine Rich Peptide n=1 Tax=Ascaris lumbricoides TaxID=6252 RepID=A0A0M3I4L4_ASCLU
MNTSLALVLFMFVILQADKVSLSSLDDRRISTNFEHARIKRQWGYWGGGMGGWGGGFGGGWDNNYGGVDIGQLNDYNINL